MGKIYKRQCEICSKRYVGRGKNTCSYSCAGIYRVRIENIQKLNDIKLQREINMHITSIKELLAKFNVTREHMEKKDIMIIIRNHIDKMLEKM